MISYDGRIFFGLAGDHDVLPDLDELATDLREALREQPVPRPKPKRKPRPKAKAPAKRKPAAKKRPARRKTATKKSSAPGRLRARVSRRRRKR